LVAVALVDIGEHLIGLKEDHILLIPPYKERTKIDLPEMVDLEV
jgi:hypothetical protein